MHRTDQILRLAAYLLCAALALLSSGCAQFLPPSAPEPATAPTPAPEPAPAPTPAPVEPAPVAAPQPTLPKIAIVLSDSKPAYQNVATELAQLLPDNSVYNLADEELSPQLAMSIIAETQTDTIVAIGLRAAIAAKGNGRFPVVFCQVFNFNDHDLISDRAKGVASLPPLDKQVEAWKQLDPGLKNVGAIVGPGHEALIAEAASATEQHDVKLHHRTARSDRETLYLFNQLLPHIDGFWLFPDNRVLSRSVLQSMLDEASRHHIQVVVFNDSLLTLGATMSATASPADIAAQIAKVVERIAAGSGESVPDMTSLTHVTIHTNDAMLLELGLPTASVESGSSTEGTR
jgi:ABC-type uncharacterized transport system substrate-binding protein